MRKLMFALSVLVVTSVLLAACGGATTAQTPATPTAGAPTPKIPIRWLTGIGSNPNQNSDVEEIIAGFNAAQDKIELSLAMDSEDADIVGPVGWAGSNLFHGQYLDLTGLIAGTGFDTSIFGEELLKLDRTEEGQMGLPFAAYPAAVYYVPAMFDEAGLNYPPAEYGQPYVMPDGTEKPWDWNTLAEIARLLTLDNNRRNATQVGFDRAQIIQVGYAPQWQLAVHMAGFWGAGAADYYDPTTLEAHVPDAASQAWQWYYEGMWGRQPFIPTGALANSPEFGSGNIFNSGKVAMTVTQSWYTCCLIEFAAAGNEFQLAVLPANPNDGQVHGRMDIDSFHIFTDSPHPNEAFDVIAYLTTTGALTQAGDILPAIEEQQAAYFDARSEQYPFVTSWQPLLDGMAYPDMPPAEGYMPNHTDAWVRLITLATGWQAPKASIWLPKSPPWKTT
jgi:multiple sugar transport system substrate-binding protein